MMRPRCWTRKLLPLLAACLIATIAQASDVIRLVVPAGVGGGTDVFFRTIARDAEPLLDATIVVMNVGGASGTIGVGQVVRAAPDGLTLGGVFMGPITVSPNSMKAPYTMDDYIPILQLTSAPYVLCVRPDFPADDGKAFIEELRRHPGKYTYGTDGVGGPGQLATERIFRALGVKAVDVPFKGAGETVPALLSKVIDIYTGSVPPGVNFEKQGRGKCLLTTSVDRIPALPNAISLKELGVPQEETLLWRGLIAPKGTPTDKVARIRDAFVQAAKAPATSRFVAEAGEEIVIYTGDEWRVRLKKEHDDFGRLVQALGLQPK